MAQMRLTTKGMILMILVLSVVMFGLGFGFWKIVGSTYISPIDSSAAQPGACGEAETKKDCGGCGPVKGATGDSFGCKWVGGSCREGNKKCNGTEIDGPTGLACNGANGTGSCGSKNPGDTTCQTDGSGKKNGYQCTCVDLSNNTTCLREWNCSDRNTSACKPEVAAPGEVNGSLGTWYNNCFTPNNPNATFSVFTCRNQSYEDGVSGGCQENGNVTGVNNQGKICMNVASNFCGWVQIDSAAGHSSAYYPCDGEEPPEETPTNICDGGGVKTPTQSSNHEVGEVVTFSGYAFDRDGINKNAIAIKVDGVTVGNATAVDKTCAAGSTDKACVEAAGKPVVEWTYSYTVTTAGAHTFDATWKDTKGIGGSRCDGSRAITSNIQGNPDWEITKTGAAVCIDETAGSQMARVDYSIVVRNVGTLVGQLTSLVDEQDSKVKNSYIQDSTISPDAAVSGNTITWDLSGSEGEFAVDEEKEFKYSIEIPQAAFGTLTNTATATPDGGDTFQATEVTIASCNAPETGLFDSAISKVVLGIILIGASGAYLYSDGGIMPKGKNRRKEFENRVAGE